MVRLFENTVTVGNTATTNEEDLHTFTVPAGRLVATGDAIFIRSWVFNAANANSKRTRVYFGSTLIGDSTALGSNNNWWAFEALIFRTGAATQKSVLTAHNIGNDSAWNTAAGGALNGTSPTETLSGTVDIRITGTSPITGAANDVQVYATTIDYLPAA